jgi:hypothetical protein
MQAEVRAMVETIVCGSVYDRQFHSKGLADVGVEVVGVEFEGFDESWSDFSSFGEDQKLGHRIASACLAECERRWL